MTLQSLLIGNQDDNQASKETKGQKKHKRTNNSNDDVLVFHRIR